MTSPLSKRRKLLDGSDAEAAAGFPPIDSRYHFRIYPHCPKHVDDPPRLKNMTTQYCPHCICYICGLLASSCKSVSHAYAQDHPLYNMNRTITSSMPGATYVAKIPPGFVRAGVITHTMRFIGPHDGIPAFAFEQFFRCPKPAGYYFCLSNITDISALTRMTDYMKCFTPERIKSNTSLLSALTGAKHGIDPLNPDEPVVATLDYCSEKTVLTLTVYVNATVRLFESKYHRLLQRLNRVSLSACAPLLRQDTPRSIARNWTLLPHQKQALAEMRYIETQGLTHKLWCRYAMADGGLMHRNTAGGFTLLPPKEGHHRGGMVDIERGYGKTLLAVTLAMADLEKAVYPGPTLIVVPHGNLVQQWLGTMPVEAKVHVVGMNSTAADIAEAHIVLAVMSRITRCKRPLPWQPDFVFHRVIIDEAHRLVGPSTGLSVSAVRLLELVRGAVWWGLTGTPRDKSISAMRGTVSLLFPRTTDVGDDRESWISQFAADTVATRSTAAQVLDAIREGVTVRPDTRQIHLPRLVTQALAVSLPAEDQELYTRVARDTRMRYEDAPRSIMRAGNAILAALSGSTPLDYFMLPEDTVDVVAMPMLPEDQAECTICMGDITRPVKTECNHYFCHRCINLALASDGRGRCPLCRQDANPLKLCLQPLAEAARIESRLVLVKIDSIVTSVARMLANRPQDSVLIFSRFPSTRRRIMAQLTALVGDVVSDSIGAFQDKVTVRALVLSTNSCAVGLHLTKANHVVLCEPSWVPDVNQQAVARAYRMGQTKEVTSYTFYCANTIEAELYAFNASHMKHSFRDLFAANEDQSMM